jgi:hypothetical protein
VWSKIVADRASNVRLEEVNCWRVANLPPFEKLNPFTLCDMDKVRKKKEGVGQQGNALY